MQATAGVAVPDRGVAVPMRCRRGRPDRPSIPAARRTGAVAPRRPRRRRAGGLTEGDSRRTTPRRGRYGRSRRCPRAVPHKAMSRCCQPLRPPSDQAARPPAGARGGREGTARRPGRGATRHGTSRHTTPEGTKGSNGEREGHERGGKKGRGAKRASNARGPAPRRADPYGQAPANLCPREYVRAHNRSQRRACEAHLGSLLPPALRL